MVTEHPQCVKDISLHHIRQVCVCVSIFMSSFQNNRGLLGPGGTVMKYLQRKIKHFLFEVGSLHRRFPEF